MSFITRLLIFVIMLYFHIIDDYKLQGILASMKQKQWWKENANKSLYRNDYKIALYEHAFSWSFSITIPLLYIALIQNNLVLMWIVFISYILNTYFHAFIDNLKANEYKINLVEDQTIHILQVLLTWIIAMGAI